MPRLIRIRTKVLMEVLGSLERCSPDPRRNTSKDFFEASPSGQKRRHVSASSPVCLHYSPYLHRKWIQSGDKAETCFHLQMTYPQLMVSDPMPGKPFQSSLIPYQEEIAALRSRRPPVSYARIADLLGQKVRSDHQTRRYRKVCQWRSGGGKVYFFRREIAAKKAPAVRLAPHTADPHPVRKSLVLSMPSHSRRSTNSNSYTASATT